MELTKPSKARDKRIEESGITLHSLEALNYLTHTGFPPNKELEIRVFYDTRCTNYIAYRGLLMEIDNQGSSSIYYVIEPKYPFKNHWQPISQCPPELLPYLERAFTELLRIFPLEVARVEAWLQEETKKAAEKERTTTLKHWRKFLKKLGFGPNF